LRLAALSHSAYAVAVACLSVLCHVEDPLQFRSGRNAAARYFEAAR
jgi:hypothetical protein